MSSSIAPRWKTAFDRAFADAPPIAQLATLDVAATTKPRVRTIVSRGFLSPTRVPALPLIVSTTDIRTPKVNQILTDSAVELAFWAPDAKEQFRIRGTAAIVPSPETEPALYAKCLDAIAGAHGSTRVYEEFKKEKFDWEKKRVEVFESLSPGMKASWCRPQIPGAPLVGGQEEAKKWPKTVEKPDSEHPAVQRLRLTLSSLRSITDPTAQEHWNTALRNFALLLIDPHDVDYVELGVIPNRRTRFWRWDLEEDNSGKDGVEIWKEEELVP
ncbi:hypothetical protein HGRIS_008653 [Hohenbuehelia grisea]|uniref:Pyridoxamine 5'-phosphate oxidase Alr4036 family FMN-binding domain-containing protein n=1 Tax=Hohenbuehelia grisea TaxID=104357 RepID=A0ABR3J8V3_9AGAR